MSEDFSDIADPDGQGSTKVDRDRRVPRFSWTPAYEATFFRSLCESVQLGLRENSSFKAEAWERATLALAESHNACPTKSHLINKSDNARKRFRLWRGLREDPEFVYNPDTKTVTAPEDAWRRRIEREPLSRALRGRPFDHESYMEVLYPDVIGSGGAPKRIMKPKRRTDCLPGDENEVPGTSVLNLREKQMAREGMLEDAASPPSTGQATAVFTALPARSANANSDAAALTPPDESSAHGRKRNLSDSGAGAPHPMDIQRNQPNSPGERSYPINSPEKRARQAMHMDLGHISSPGMLNSSILPLATPPANATPGSQHETSLPSIRRAFAEELADSVTGRGARHWREDAVDLFFRDFCDESTEVQIGISQTVLSDEHTAMVFCKMPPRAPSFPSTSSPSLATFTQLANMSYANAASKGPKQTPEEAAAAPVPEIVQAESASTASLIDVDLPSVHTVSSEFLEQDVQTDTQAKRLEREAAEAKAKAEKAAGKASGKISDKAKKAAGKAKGADNWLTAQFSKLTDKEAGGLAVTNLVTLVGVSSALGYKAWGLYSEGRLSWQYVGAGVGILAAVGAAESFVGAYLYKGKGKKDK